MESPHPKFLGHLVKLRQLSSKTFPFLEGNMPMSAATSRRKEEENSSVENEKKIKCPFLFEWQNWWSSHFSLFALFGKQKKESTDIKAVVWMLRLWRGWEAGCSCSHRALLGHSLVENSHAAPLALSVTTPPKAENTGDEAAGGNVCLCVAARLPIALRTHEAPGGCARGRRGWGDNRHCSHQMRWAWTAPRFGCKASKQESCCSQSVPKIREAFRAVAKKVHGHGAPAHTEQCPARAGWFFLTALTHMYVQEQPWSSGLHWDTSELLDAAVLPTLFSFTFQVLMFILFNFKRISWGLF